MIKKKQIRLFVCICMMLLVFSGCSKVPTKAEDPAITMKVALEKLNKVDAFSATVTAENETAVNGESTTANSKTDVVVQYNPFAVKLLNQNDTSEGDQRSVETYLVQEKDTISAYMKTDGQWTTQDMDQDTALASIRAFDVKETMVQFITNASAWKKNQEKDGLGIYEGVIPKDSLFTVLENTRLLQSVGMSGLTSTYFEGVSDLTFRISINEETGYPIGYEVDLGPVLQVATDNVMKSLQQGNTAEYEMNVVKYVMKAAVSTFEKSKKIKVPQEGIDSAVDFSQQDAVPPVVPDDGFTAETEE